MTRDLKKRRIEHSKINGAWCSKHNDHCGCALLSPTRLVISTYLAVLEAGIVVVEAGTLAVEAGPVAVGAKSPVGAAVAMNAFHAAIVALAP